LLADTLEALIGAVYLDGGLEAAGALAVRLLDDEIAAVAAHGAARNSKAILQEVLQRFAQKTPVYTVLGEDGPQHERRFVAAAFLDGRELGRGEGRSKKEAEQRAAEAALGALLGELGRQAREGAAAAVVDLAGDALRRALAAGEPAAAAGSSPARPDLGPADPA
jgi:ribonuclease-3